MRGRGLKQPSGREVLPLQRSPPMRGRGLKLMLGLGMMLMLANCAPQLSQLPPSPEKTYAQALTIYNDANEAYVAALMLQTPEVKAQWKQDINPELDKADEALDAWFAVLGMANEYEKRELYLAIWRKLFPLLFQLGIIEVEE